MVTWVIVVNLELLLFFILSNSLFPFCLYKSADPLTLSWGLPTILMSASVPFVCLLTVSAPGTADDLASLAFIESEERLKCHTSRPVHLPARPPPLDLLPLPAAPVK